MKVVKFGGSSVASATQIQKVGGIIKSDPERKIVVVSAPGKRNNNDIKITDMLIDLGHAYLQNKTYKDYLDKIMKRFEEIIQELNIPLSVLEDIEHSINNVLSRNLSDEIKFDAIKALGEDSSAKIVSEYLKHIGLEANYINPKDAGIMVSNELGEARILPESFSNLYALRERSDILVIPGFFGYTKEGNLATFPRGGSDITGSIVAAGVKAALYENFTDVDSVFSVNPNIVDNPKEITKLTYKEMRELSYAGFSVFHDEALIPAFNEKIPVAIKNTNNPQSPGTKIVAEKESLENCVVGIASDTGFSSIYISKYLMNRELGFGRKLFSILEDEMISFEHAPSGIDDMSIIIRDDQLTPEKEPIILKRIKEELQADTVSIHRDLAIIMVVGEGMNSTIGIAQKATSALKEANVNIEMINQGSSEVSMMFGIQAEGIDRAIQSLYDAYFGK
ncbi:aspartate kinase [Virgibacillus alimentarius]|uniref:aspartate kinase n=1 Tax=Virgibacillus alimentarius TaxID=698769 RepID=UPI0004936AC2|nr:aspartate kinase [Virgibacillus alimentarius]